MGSEMCIRDRITQGQINWLCNVQRIKIILTLTENTLEENKLRIVGLQSYKHVPMADHSVPKYSEILSAVNYLQDNYGKAPILIHCYGGKGRTGVILGSFLAVKYNLTSDQAIGKVRAIWPKFIEKGQETAIKTFIDTIKLSK